jgi:hypothetical protein
MTSVNSSLSLPDVEATTDPWLLMSATARVSDRRNSILNFFAGFRRPTYVRRGVICGIGDHLSLMLPDTLSSTLHISSLNNRVKPLTLQPARSLGRFLNS